MNNSNKLRLLATVALIPAICLMPGKANAFDLVFDTLKNDPNLKIVVGANEGDTLQSGDFTLVSLYTDGLDLGDGVNEMTKWSFDFSPISTSIATPLKSAILDLTLTNSHPLITTDTIGIDGLGGVSVKNIKTISGDSLLSQLPPGQPTAVQIDLLQYSQFSGIENLFNSNGGIIDMYYQDDVIISSARLTLKTVPEPTAAAGLLLLGTIGAGSMLKRQRQNKALEDNLS